MTVPTDDRAATAVSAHSCELGPAFAGRLEATGHRTAMTGPWHPGDGPV